MYQSILQLGPKALPCMWSSPVLNEFLVFYWWQPVDLASLQNHPHCDCYQISFGNL